MVGRKLHPTNARQVNIGLAAKGVGVRKSAGAATLGWLTSASGMGALASGLPLAAQKSVLGLTRMLQIAAAALGSGLILFGLSLPLWLSLR